MNKIDLKNKIIQLHFDANKNDYEFDTKSNELNIFDCTYLLLTDEEADDLAAEYIKDSLWTFRAGFLEEMTGMDAEIFEVLQEKYEDSNSSIMKIIEATCGIDDFIESSIKYDGRGQFISYYDGKEECISYGDKDLFLYRI